MSTIVKVVEVIAQSEKSFDDAAQPAVRQAAVSVRGQALLPRRGERVAMAPTTRSTP